MYHVSVQNPLSNSLRFVAFNLLKEENCTIVIQVDGRKRGILEMPINSKEPT